MSTDNKKIPSANSQKLTPEMFDRYAPPIFGKILTIVNKIDIAEVVLEKVFKTAYIGHTSFPIRSPLMSLMDIAEEKSKRTLKALEIFRQCCSGASVSIVKK